MGSLSPAASSIPSVPPISRSWLGERSHRTRPSVPPGEDAIETLRRVKEDVREVKAGLECGIKLAGYDDIKVGDRFEAYIRETFQRTL